MTGKVGGNEVRGAVSASGTSPPPATGATGPWEESVSGHLLPPSLLLPRAGTQVWRGDLIGLGWVRCPSWGQGNAGHLVEWPLQQGLRPRFYMK